MIYPSHRPRLDKTRFRPSFVLEREKKERGRERERERERERNIVGKKKLTIVWEKKTILTIVWEKKRLILFNPNKKIVNFSQSREKMFFSFKLCRNAS